MQHGNTVLSTAFYDRIGEHKESLKSHIESLVDTSEMVVVYNDDADQDKFIIHLCWGHFMYRPRFCLSRPCSTFIISVFVLCGGFVF